jgi:hypothetical protein
LCGASSRRCPGHLYLSCAGTARWQGKRRVCAVPTIADGERWWARLEAEQEHIFARSPSEPTLRCRASLPVAITPSRLATRCARGFARNSSPFEQRARGNAGCRCTRSLVRESGRKSAHEYSQRVHRISPAFPHTMALRLIGDLPGDRAYLSPSPRIPSVVRARLGRQHLRET